MFLSITGFVLCFFIAAAVAQSIIRFAFAINSKLRHNPRAPLSDVTSDENTLQPTVCILVPAYNEALVIERTIENLLCLDYSNYEVIIIDDGSTDNTLELAEKWVKKDSRVSTYRIANSKRAGALNYGMSKTEAEFLVCTDADSLLESQALRIAVQRLRENSNLGAVAGNLRVGNKNSLLTQFQSIEYDILNYSRFAQNSYRKVNLVPGPVGVFRHSMVRSAGGFSTETYAEDTDLTTELIKRGYDVYYETKCVVWTEAPNSLSDLYQQRYRWVRGLMQVLTKHKDIVSSGTLFPRITMLTLSNTFAWSFLISLVLLTTGLIYLTALALGVETNHIGQFWLALFLVESFTQLVSVFTLQQRLSILVLLPFKILLYDSLRCLWSFKFIADQLRQTEMSWNKLERYGTSLGNALTSKQ